MTALAPVAISYSGGTSSEWLVEAVIRGILPRADKTAVFFADTGGEHEWTYRHVDEVEDRCHSAKLPFFRVRKPGPTLAEHIIAGASASADSGRLRIDQPPFYIDKGDSRGRVQQRCSREFKQRVLRRAQRQWLRDHGYRKPVLSSWIGFAADEAHRGQRATAKPDVAWARLEFPAIRMAVPRAQQRADLIKWTGRAPKFSMCVFCPHKTSARWAATEGADADLAIKVDEAIRDVDVLGLTDGPAYLSSQLVPVSRLVRKPELAADEPEPNGCDAGACFL